MTPIIEFKHVSKTFTLHDQHTKIQALDDINLSLNKGSFLGIVGKSGSGKSTILKSLYRTNKPEKGEIWYVSKTLGRVNLFTLSDQDMIYLRNNEIGYVSQFLKLLPRMTAYDYVKNSLLDLDDIPNDLDILTMTILNHFQLDKALWNLYPNTFSGGEKLRLNLAAQMVKKPTLLLLDEPTASLDDSSKIIVKQLITQLKKEGTTMIGIFHDISFMSDLCDEIIEIKGGKHD
jgi:alpha-D-ribose 1-methylphosphonate 5-triphosphate synthase subunit PhnL